MKIKMKTPAVAKAARLGWILAAIFGPILVASCMTGPKTKPKSSLNYLNGEHYGANTVTTGPGGAIPVLIERKERSTTVSGQVFLKSDNIPLPLRGQRLRLRKDEQSIAQAVSGAQGDFKFQAVIPNGDYELELVSERYKGSVGISVDSYDVTGLQVVAVEAHEN